MVEERDAPVGAHRAGEGLGRVMQQGSPAQRIAARQLVGQRLAQQARHRIRQLGDAQNLPRVRLQGDRARERLERVPVHVAVVVAALLHPAQRLQLSQHRRGDPERVHQLQALQRAGRGDDAA